MRVARGVVMIIKGTIYLATMDGLKKLTGIIHEGDLVTIQIKPARKEEECPTTSMS